MRSRSWRSSQSSSPQPNALSEVLQVGVLVPARVDIAEGESGVEQAAAARRLGGLFLAGDVVEGGHLVNGLALQQGVGNALGDRFQVLEVDRGAALVEGEFRRGGIARGAEDPFAAQALHGRIDHFVHAGGGGQLGGAILVRAGGGRGIVGGHLDVAFVGGLHRVLEQFVHGGDVGVLFQIARDGQVKQGFGGKQPRAEGKGEYGSFQHLISFCGSRDPHPVLLRCFRTGKM
jgi:hypothetical protein